MRRIFIAIALVCLGATTATAQSKLSATAQCDQPDTRHEIPVGDLPDHSLAVLQLKCNYTKSMEIEGAKAVSTVVTITNEVSGDTVRAQGCQVITMDSGDKVFARHQGTGTSEGQDGTWTFTGGTGKLKGIKGKGTYSCSSSGCDIAGEYQLAK